MYYHFVSFTYYSSEKDSEKGWILELQDLSISQVAPVTEEGNIAFSNRDSFKNAPLVSLEKKPVESKVIEKVDDSE